MRPPPSQDRVLLFLAVSAYAAVALLAYVAMPAPTVTEAQCLRVLEGGGGFGIGAYVPGSLSHRFRTRTIRLAVSLTAAVGFYAVAPWGHFW
jgi:hypothetical protein